MIQFRRRHRRRLRMIRIVMRCYVENGDDEREGFLKSQFLRLLLLHWQTTMIVMMHLCVVSDDEERGGYR